jgi:hypothetical protein
MRTATRFFWILAVLAIVVSMSGLSIFGATTAQTINLPTADNFALQDDDDPDEPEVKARVARVSFLRGNAKIKRVGQQDWEAVTLNLPVVQGDEIVTDQGSRIELQFDRSTHVRLEENSHLKVTTLKEEGIALSVDLGTMNVRVTSFDKSQAFLEIDAPKTTLAVEKAGSYRIDAGQVSASEIRVTTAAGGEARVYSDTAGFTLKSGRSARIVVDGPNAGEWNTDDASKSRDEFDTWTADRDDVIARRLRTAHYGSYYDDDIYGADDLTDNGEWVHTQDYGYVWRPYRTVLTRYVDWSPYRYGHWRWTPPFGWVWVNDEPWGWATYHHGRWVYVSGGWVWSPYGYYRPRRSWWFPALVAINISFNNVCWYPLGYRHRYRRFNNHHNNWGGGRGRDRDDRGQSTSGDVKQIPPVRGTGRERDIVPPEGVVAVDTKQFGGTGATKRLSINLAKKLIEDTIDGAEIPQLPVNEDVKRNAGRSLVAEKPQIVDAVATRRSGATDRRSDAPLDEELKKTRIYGGRDPVRTETIDTPVKPETRKTGVFDRDTPVKPQPRSDPPKETRRQPDPIRMEPRNDPPKETRRQPDPVRIEPPKETRRQPDPVKVEPRNDPPKETRRAPDPVKVEKPPEKTVPTKQEPPKKDTPPPMRKPDPITGR